MAGWEREHIVAAFQFELGKVDHQHVREAAVEQINHVDHDLAVTVARGIGVAPPTAAVTTNHGRSSPALSQANSVADSIATRKVAVLVTDGVAAIEVDQIRRGLSERGATAELLCPHDGTVRAVDASDIGVDRAINTMSSVLYDAVVIPGGNDSVRALAADGYAVHFVAEAYKHAKPVAASREGMALLQRAGIYDIRLADERNEVGTDSGVITTTAGPGGSLPQRFITEFVSVLSGHRVWSRDTTSVPA